MYRGHNIKLINGSYVYSDTKEPVAFNINRACGYCGLNNTPEGHDSCLGTLPNVMNACCGHGEDESAYIQYKDGKTLRGLNAKKIIDKRGKLC